MTRFSTLMTQINADFWLVFEVDRKSSGAVYNQICRNCLVCNQIFGYKYDFIFFDGSVILFAQS